MKPEQILSSRIAGFIRSEYPDLIFRFDLAADIPLPPHLAKRSKELHGKYNRGYPDLFIAKVVSPYGGLYLELKATKKVLNNDHTIRQSYIHAKLRKAGYKVLFCCGYKECKKAIKNYLS